MKRKLLGLLLLINVLSVSSVFAQSAISSNYNWCNDANAWGDGRCTQSTQVEVTSCYQMLGWYLPQVASGAIESPAIFENACLSTLSEITVQQQNGCTTLNVSLASGSQLVSNCPVVVEEVVEVADNSPESTPPPPTNQSVVNNVSPSADYNFCSDPDVWGNGKCENSDTTIQACMWEMGWYLPRVASGEISLNDIESPCLYAVADTVIVEKDESTGCSYIVVVLAGSPYTGKADITEASNDYDGSTVALGKHCGLKIHGNDNDNQLVGSTSGDYIYGYGGDDAIVGDSISEEGTGDDVIDGGSGNDWIYSDSIYGDGSGNDTIYGGDGNDVIYADSYQGVGSGNDTIYAGDGDDSIYGDSSKNAGSGDDVIYGDAGNDVISADSNKGAGSGNDIVYGGDGNDIIYGDSVESTGSGNDTIYGGAGDDKLNGDSYSGHGSGNDVINGGEGNDQLYGDSTTGTGNGDDKLDGGDDNDTAMGPGKDGDTFNNIETDNSTGDTP